MPEYQVTIKKVAPQLVASIRAVLPTYNNIGQLYGEIFRYLGEKSVFMPAGPMIFISHDSSFKERDADVEAAVPINKNITGSDRVKVYELLGIEAASITHKGPHEGVSKAYSTLMAWIGSNGYQVIGPTRQLFLTNPGMVKNPSENVTEIQLPVKKA
jgi:effector-binding domain-containing protein